MSDLVKWVMSIRPEQRDWLQAISEKVDLSTAEIGREMFDRAMTDKSFVASLAQAQQKIKLQTLDEKIAALNEERKKTQAQYGGVKVTA